MRSRVHERHGVAVRTPARVRADRTRYEALAGSRRGFGAGFVDLVLVLALVLTVLAAYATAAQAAVGGAVGADYYTRSDGLEYKAAVGALGGRWNRLGLAGAVTRYDDGNLGTGLAGTAVVTGYGGGHWGGRAVATRWWGENDYRAWRLAAGPVLEHPLGSTLFLYGARFAEETGFATSEIGATGELRFPGPWSFRGGAALSVDDDGTSGLRLSTGVGLRPAPRLELGVEGGVSRGATGPGGTSSAGSATGGGLLGRGSPFDSPELSPTDDTERTEATLQVSLRVLFP